MKLPDASGIVIDGFPRDVAQALSFEDQVGVFSGYAHKTQVCGYYTPCRVLRATTWWSVFVLHALGVKDSACLLRLVLFLLYCNNWPVIYDYDFFLLFIKECRHTLKKKKKKSIYKLYLMLRNTHEASCFLWIPRSLFWFRWFWRNWSLLGCEGISRCFFFWCSVASQWSARCVREQPANFVPFEQGKRSEQNVTCQCRSS